MNTSIAAISSRKKEALAIMLGALATAVILAFSHGGGFAYATDANSSATGSPAGGTTATATAADSANSEPSIQVGGTDFYGSMDVSGSTGTKVDVVAVEAPKSATLYFDIYKLGENGSKEYLAKRYSWSLKNADATDADEQVGSARIDLGLLRDANGNLVNEDGLEHYRIAVYWDSETRANPQVFKLYGVYAKLHDANGAEVGSKLIGLRSVPEGSDSAGRAYVAPNTYYDASANDGAGQSYCLRASASSTALSPIFDYYAYDPATTLSGTVTFVDDNGNVLRTNTLAGISEDNPVTYAIPAIIEVRADDAAGASGDGSDDAATDGASDAAGDTTANVKYYRTVSAVDSVTFEWPATLEHTIHCVPVVEGEVERAQYAPYTMKIEYVVRTTDENGAVTETTILTDSVQIAKTNLYTLPKSFYTSHISDDKTGATDTNVTSTYTLDAQATAESVSTLASASASFNKNTNELTIKPHVQENSTNALTDEAPTETPAEIVKVVYTCEEGHGSEAEYIVCCWDASKSAGQAASGARPTLMSRETVTVAPNGTASYTPKERLANSQGTELVLFGEPVARTFTNEKGLNEQTVVNYYYVKEGAQYMEPYDVTVQYVDIASNTVLDSYAITIPGNSTADVTIPAGPQKLTVDDKEYVRLDGQSASYSHSYVAPYRTYTIYYRDVNDATYANTVVTRTVILESDANNSSVNTENGRLVGLEQGAAFTQLANANSASAGAAANATGAAGDDTDAGAAGAAAEPAIGGALLTEDGTDTATEREINDNENPLSAGTTGDVQDSSFLPANAVYGIAAGVGALALLAAGLLYRRHRKLTQQSQDDAR